MTVDRPSIAIVGAGAVGRAVGRLLCEAGYPIAAVASRSRDSVRAAIGFIGQGTEADSPADAARRAEVTLISTPDGAIQAVCGEIAREGAFRTGVKVFHFSGAMESSILNDARACGAHVAALHPLQSFPSAEEAVKRLKGTVFTFEGDKDAEPFARAMAEAMGADMISIEASAKALYHAACCVLSNYAVSVADLGFALLERAGIPRGDAMRACLPLMKGTLANMESLGVPEALTGPVDRGDYATIQRQLDAMGDLPEEVRNLYCRLGLHTLDVAQRKRPMDPDAVRRLRELLTKALRGA